MSRAPPTTPAVKFPESSAISESPKNSLLTTEGNTKTLYPQLFNVSTSLCFENLPVKDEKYFEHETLHTIPQKLVISSHSCSSNAIVSEIDHFSALKKNAYSGESSAQNQLGQYYLSGNNVDINQSKAVSWFRKAALKNNKEAQLNLAVAYKEGRGIKKDLTLATYWLLKSCSSDEGRNVTISYHRDLIKFIAPVLAEFPDFRALKKIEFHRLGLSGDLSTQSDTSLAIGENQGSSEPKISIKKKAEFAVGLLVNSNESQAVLERHTAPSCNSSVSTSAAAEQSPHKSQLVLLQASAFSGNSTAQYDLGQCFEFGISVKKNHDEAKCWYLRAAEQGHVRAQYCLGLLYSQGRQIVQDYEQAVYWFRKAADQNDPCSQCNLGAMYASGRGVDQDDDEALLLYK